MEKIEIDLYFKSKATVVFGEDSFTSEGISHLHDEIEVDPEDCGFSFDEYQMMYQSALQDLNWRAEKSWGKYDPPSSIEIKITQMTEEEFSKESKC